MRNHFFFHIHLQPFLVHEIAVKDEEESHGDGLCFSIIHGPEVMTLRAATKVDKRQWIDKISTQSQYVMAIQKRGLKSNSAAGLLNPLGSNRLDAIGTLEVTVCEGNIKNGCGGIFDY